MTHFFDPKLHEVGSDDPDFTPIRVAIGTRDFAAKFENAVEGVTAIALPIAFFVCTISIILSY